MRPLRDLRQDETGTFLVFFAIALAVLLGIVALSFDLGRVAATQTELQSYADEVALAAAAELDGNPDAIARALQAARNLITDTQTFAEEGQELTFADLTLTFLRGLPADDDFVDMAGTIVCSGLPCETASAAAAGDATLVRVDVNPHTLPMAFASVLSVLTGGEEQEANVGASATAGFTQFACDITPLMFCMPPGGVLPGQMVKMRTGGNGAAWGPGNFGFLEISAAFRDPNGPCAGKNGANLTRCMLGAVDQISQCYSMRGVNTDTGQRVGITTDPFNYRFDIFPNSSRDERESADYAPAPNVIDGIQSVLSGNKCDAVATSTLPATEQTKAFPRDPAMVADPNLRFGPATTFALLSTERRTYMEWNYGDRDLSTALADPYPTALTRYAVYRAEIDRFGGTSSATAILGAPRGETGRPQCSAHRNGSYERRVLVVAGIDCAANDIRGNTPNVPVEEFYEIFMTEPVGLGPTASDIDIIGEVISSAGGSGSGGTTGGGIFRDVVQLYR